MISIAALFAFCDLHASRVGSFFRLEDALSDPAAFVNTMAGWPRYFDRQGFPIPADDGLDPTLVWARRMEGDPAYRIVAQDTLPDGSTLSTCWLGLDHGYGGRPLFFETMRFSSEKKQGTLPGGHVYLYRPDREFPDPFGEEGAMTEQLRYGSEEEALAAHHAILRCIRIREGH